MNITIRHTKAEYEMTKELKKKDKRHKKGLKIKIKANFYADHCRQNA